MTKNKQKVIVILGPTASGKSDLAVEIAKKFNGEIISADSRQVYRGLDLGAGKIPRDKFPPKNYELTANSYFYKGIPHYLLDVANPKRTFTVAQYQKLANKAIEKISKKNKIPIICGGTGLYIDSIIYGSRFPQVPPQLKLRKKLEKLSAEELFTKLEKIDPVRSRNIDSHNRRRLIRALEIVITTKRPIPFAISTDSELHNTLIIGIKKSKEESGKLIFKRLKKRLKQGMIKEVENLHNGKALNPEGRPSASYGISWKRLDDFGLEYRFISRYLRGLISKQEMIALIQKESEKYAKRQMTWFKRNKKIYWVESPDKAINLIKSFLD